MTARQDWKLSSTSLRRLLRVVIDKDSSVDMYGDFYKFGIFYRSRNNMYYIYNIKTDNIIATVKDTGSYRVMRYRAKSVYANILMSFDYGPSTVKVQSPNLGRHRSEVRDECRHRVSSFYHRGQSPRQTAQPQPRQSFYDMNRMVFDNQMSQINPVEFQVEFNPFNSLWSSESLMEAVGERTDDVV